MDDGSLCESILGRNKITITTFAIERGKRNEGLVLKEVEKKLKTKIKKCGILLNGEYPMFGASPDGLEDLAVFEVKCPISEENIQRYYKKKSIQVKYRAQIQLQMLFAKRKVNYFCIGNPDFEKSKEVIIIKDFYDQNFLKCILEKAKNYWEKYIFTKLMSA